MILKDELEMLKAKLKNDECTNAQKQNKKLNRAFPLLSPIFQLLEEEMVFKF